MSDLEPRYVYRPLTNILYGVCIVISFYLVIGFTIYTANEVDREILLLLLVFPLIPVPHIISFSVKRERLAKELNIRYTSDRTRATHIIYYNPMLDKLSTKELNRRLLSNHE